MYDIKRSLELLVKNRDPWPEGADGLEKRTHRQMVGGMWDEIGSLQFNFLKNQGLLPENTFLDIGCGSFRAGRFFIEYLNFGNYYGVDKQAKLVEIGKAEELGFLLSDKSPNIFITDKFDFSTLNVKPDFVVAQSVFTHLNPKDIRLCLSNLAKISSAKTSFYCTFFEVQAPVMNISRSHSSRTFEYTADQMSKFGEKYGWNTDYIGDWQHPRNQKIIRYFR